METTPKYRGEFLSRKGVKYRVELYQGSDTPFETATLDFPAETPLIVEWEETGKEEPVVASTATLKVISPADRTFTDLYTVRAGSVRMDVYRDGRLYWSGTLDPEFYEEPYERADGYEVSLTFSDFGILDRLGYAATGRVTLMDVVRGCLTASAIKYNEVRTGFISSRLKDGTTGEYTRRLSLYDLSVLSTNFYDEDGEPLTLREVLKGILQPLALRITQRNGHIWIYDINGLASSDAVREVVWNGDSQTLSVDKVYNNIKVTFSPYAADKVLDGSVSASDLTEPEETVTYYSDYNWDDIYNRPFGAFEFTPYRRSKSNAVVLDTDQHPMRYFKMSALLGGQDCAGVAWLWRGSFPDANSSRAHYDDCYGAGGAMRAAGASTIIPQCTDARATDNPIFHTPGAMIAATDPGDLTLKLRVKMDILLDPRYNPFEEEGKYNESGNTGWHKSKMVKVYIPCALWVETDDGRKWTYYNRGHVNPHPNSSPETDFLGGWREREPSPGDYWLSYYNMEDMTQCFGDGWTTNNPMPWHMDLTSQPKMIKKRGAGDYITPPPVSGTLHFQVYAGYYCPYMTAGLTNVERWFLYRNIDIAFVKANGGSIDDDAIEYAAVLNEDAREELSIDTICGTSPDPMPCARGLYFDSVTERGLDTISRAGAVDCPEVMLQATMFSQYATRHNALSGECELAEVGLSPLVERCQGGRKFMAVESHQDLIADTDDIKIVEINEDDYQAVRTR